MGRVTTDQRGRVTIPKNVRERFGEEYRLVELEDGIKLVPIPDDPVAALRNVASDEFKQASQDDLRDAARKTARDEVDEHVR